MKGEFEKWLKTFSTLPPKGGVAPEGIALKAVQSTDAAGVVVGELEDFKNITYSHTPFFAYLESQRIMKQYDAAYVWERVIDFSEATEPKALSEGENYQEGITATFTPVAQKLSPITVPIKITEVARTMLKNDYDIVAGAIESAMILSRKIKERALLNSSTVTGSENLTFKDLPTQIQEAANAGKTYLVGNVELTAPENLTLTKAIKDMVLDLLSRDKPTPDFIVMSPTGNQRLIDEIYSTPPIRLTFSDPHEVVPGVYVREYEAPDGKRLPIIVSPHAPSDKVLLLNADALLIPHIPETFYRVPLPTLDWFGHLLSYQGLIVRAIDRHRMLTLVQPSQP